MVLIDTQPPISIRTPEDVRKLLESEGIHYYFKYTVAVEMSDVISQAQQHETFDDGAEAAEWILGQLREYESRQDAKLERLDAGAQDFVQPKLVEICELLRRNHHEAHLDLTTRPTENSKEFVDAPAHWYQIVRENGLCGGWAAVHRQRPQWFEALWTAVKTWKPQEGRSTREEVDDLGTHLRSKVSRDITEDPLNDVVNVLTTAYGLMAQLEKTAGYGSVPPTFSKLDFLGEVRPHYSKTLKALFYASAGQEVFNAITAGVKCQQGEHIAHIETSEHHISVRVNVGKGGKLKDTWNIVESERAGVVSSNDKQTIYRILRDGIFLRGRSEETQDNVALKVYQSPGG